MRTVSARQAEVKQKDQLKTMRKLPFGHTQIENEVFAAIWTGSQNLETVVTLYNRNPRMILDRVWRLRNQGVRLKEMPNETEILCQYLDMGCR